MGEMKIKTTMRGWLHSVVVSTSALHAEGPGFVPKAEPQTILQVCLALGCARPPEYAWGARPWRCPGPGCTS